MNPGLLAPLLAYGDALDRKDWASARACFLPEVEAALAPLLTRHRVEPLEVEEQGGKARVRSRYRIERVDPRRPAPNHLHTEGEYEHRLRRYPEGWRIVAVRQTLTFKDGDRSIRVGAAQAPEASR
jgi:hypothetical protein